MPALCSDSEHTQNFFIRLRLRLGLGTGNSPGVPYSVWVWYNTVYSLLSDLRDGDCRTYF